MAVLHIKAIGRGLQNFDHSSFSSLSSGSVNTLRLGLLPGFFYFGLPFA